MSITLAYTGKFDVSRRFDRFEVERYDTLDTLVSDYYEQTTFDDVHDAYAVWDTLHALASETGVDIYPSEPTDRLSFDEQESCLVEGDTLYVRAEQTDSASHAASWDGLVEYEGEWVDVVSGREWGSYSVRAPSGAELVETADDQLPDRAFLYEEVGSLSTRRIGLTH